MMTSTNDIFSEFEGIRRRMERTWRRSGRSRADWRCWGWRAQARNGPPPSSDKAAQYPRWGSTRFSNGSSAR